MNRGRKPGTPKTGGRKKGTPNAVTGSLREFYAKLIDDNRTEIITRLRRLDDVAFFQALDRINKYVLPTLTSVSSEVEIKNKLEALTDNQLDDLINELMNRQPEAEQE